MNGSIMSSKDHKPTLKTLRIIVGAMCGGCIMFGAIAIFVQSSREQDNSSAALVSTIAAIFAASAFLAGFVVPRVLNGIQISALSKKLNGQESPDDIRHQLFGDYFAVVLISAALAEGSTLFAIVAYMIEGHVWTLAVGGFMLVVLLMQWPSEDRFENWRTDRQEQLKHLQLFSG